MPSSVVFAALVLAWLVVLVPVVARRRQMVPRPAEADLSARVLPRSAGVPLIEEVPVATAQTDGRGGARAAVAAGAGATTPGRGGTALVERAERPDETQEALDAELDLDADRDDLDRDEDGYGDDRDDRALDDEPTREIAGDGRDRPAGGRERVLRRPAHEVEDIEDLDDDDLDDEFDDELDDLDDLDDDGFEPPVEPARELRPYRPGRGGFDPDAAAAAAHARYAFRQRVALGVIAVAILSALAALVVSSAMWWLHAVADVALVGYLVFLRRQTRIEEEVRVRRAARLSGERRALEARRERQAEHEARMASYRDTEWIDGEYEARDDRDEDVEYGEYDDDEPELEEQDAPRWAAPRTPPPPVPDDLELVDDTDDDPAFHDLDGERTYGYRRAAGA
ncbi:divisome protein SepX/GlpR [Actinomycetospora aeridis]|uniref:Gephyrin-like molybdotransferase receptor GlpR n=1 Tax=Actinomycetospora aeridis TaxID=3129231 RepID=A0ABU8MYV6_9PSEU